MFEKAAHQSDKCFVIRLVTAAMLGAVNGGEKITHQNLKFSLASGNNFKFLKLSSHNFHLLLLLLLLLLLTAIELSLCGSSPYTSTEKTNKNKYT